MTPSSSADPEAAGRVPARLAGDLGERDPDQRDAEADERAGVFEEHHRDLRVLRGADEVPPRRVLLPHRQGFAASGAQRQRLEHDRDAEHHVGHHRRIEVLGIAQLVDALGEREQRAEREQHERHHEGPEVALLTESERVLRGRRRRLRRPPRNSRPWFPVSATEWMASASIEADPVTANATNFAAAMPRLARNAATIARRVPSCIGDVPHRGGRDPRDRAVGCREPNDRRSPLVALEPSRDELRFAIGRGARPRAGSARVRGGFARPTRIGVVRRARRVARGRHARRARGTSRRGCARDRRRRTRRSRRAGRARTCGRDGGVRSRARARSGRARGAPRLSCGTGAGA